MYAEEGSEQASAVPACLPLDYTTLGLLYSTVKDIPTHGSARRLPALGSCIGQPVNSYRLERIWWQGSLGTLPCTAAKQRASRLYLSEPCPHLTAHPS